MSSILLDEAALKRAVAQCPRLASLRSINEALSELMHSEQNPASKIADIIRKDPALTTRLLKLTNSAFFGLSQEVTSIEDAVLFLGIRQIRELALATPIIEDFETLRKINEKVNWTSLWQHSIAVAILTRELLSIANIPANGETHYIAGLLHNIGKIVIAQIAPEAFNELLLVAADTPEAFCQEELRRLGWDHAEIGAYYLIKHELPEAIVRAVRFHHAPEMAEPAQPVSAALQIADTMARFTGLTHIEQTAPVQPGAWKMLPAWGILFPSNFDNHPRIAAIEGNLERLPEMVRSMGL